MRRGNGSKHVPAKCAATVAQQGRDGRRASSSRREPLQHIELMIVTTTERDWESAFGRKYASRVLEGLCFDQDVVAFWKLLDATRFHTSLNSTFPVSVFFFFLLNLYQYYNFFILGWVMDGVYDYDYWIGSISFLFFNESWKK